MASVPAFRPRRYLMCEPRHFAVPYSINPWMTEGAAVDAERAVAQWRELVETYRRLGHSVDLVEPAPGLTDMVFAANCAVTVGGRVFGSRFHATERQPETAEYELWFKTAGFEPLTAETVCEGEGDLTPVGEVILAGHGFRTDPRAHLQAQEYLGVPTVSLRLVDPYFYHLDTALFALDDTTVAYYPDAFSPGSQEVLRRMYPDAVLASREDALAFGLNSVSDGHHVVIAPQATGLIRQVRERGFVPVPVDTSELHKSGGGIKCCTQEIRTS